MTVGERTERGRAAPPSTAGRIAFDLEVRRGAFTVRGALDTTARVSGLFGPTGSGKTSLLLALCGLVRPARGRFVLDGRTLIDVERGLFVPVERREVAIVFQEGRLFPHLTVRGNLTFARSAQRDRTRFDEVVHLFDLEALLERSSRQLSGGQARLVAVARALLSKPRLLLLDEPLTGLDPALRRRVLAYFLRLEERTGVRMMLVSHVFSDFLALADEVALLGGGRVVRTGPPEALIGDALESEGAGPAETTVQGLVATAAGDRAEVVCGRARLALFLPHARPGEMVTVTVRAQDVILGIGEPPRTSARNVLRGRVSRVIPAGEHAVIAVEVGTLLWAEITREAAEGLKLEPGREVYALVKASAIRGVVLPR
jgi:molybdate transport system ATP-binding protein